MTEDLKKLQKKINVNFTDPSLLDRALIHRSYTNENREVTKDNERLEFLGDAVLELLTTEFLFHNYPNKPEGELTSIRAATVRTETLAEASRELGYGPYIRMSKGEENTAGREKDYILANTFEAVVGAIYIDQGFESCREFLTNHLFGRIPVIVENNLDIDAKTKFQEIAQEKYKVTPIYKVKDEFGPDHNKTFITGVYLNTKEFGEGAGSSKQKAEEAAAQEGLEKLDSEGNLESSI